MTVKLSMVAKGMSGNSFRFIGEEDGEDEASLSLLVAPATKTAAADDLAGTLLSFFFRFWLA